MLARCSGICAPTGRTPNMSSRLHARSPDRLPASPLDRAECRTGADHLPFYRSGFQGSLPGVASLPGAGTPGRGVCVLPSPQSQSSLPNGLPSCTMRTLSGTLPLPNSLRDCLQGVEGFTPEELHIMYLVRELGSVKKTAAHTGLRRDHVGKVYRRAQEKNEKRSCIRAPARTDPKLPA